MNNNILNMTIKQLFETFFPNSEKIFDIWKKMLQELKSYDGVHEEDVERNTSSEIENCFVGDFISKYIDLEDILDENGDINLEKVGRYWNESILQLAGKIDDWPDEARRENFKNFIKNADSGNSFDEQNPWVIPWTMKRGVETNNYSEIRDTDKNFSALNSKESLQFTKLKDFNWIRLIMPKNIRRVEIEDLNRNFWVIGNVLYQICRYIYIDNDFSDIIKSILDELIQLWENILSLWMIIVVKTLQNVMGVKTIFYPISDNILIKDIQYEQGLPQEPFSRNYNDFIKNFSHLPQKYQNYHLCVIPYIRKTNYYKNYYSKIEIPAVYLYNTILNKWQEPIHLKKIVDNQIEETIEFDIDSYENFIYAVHNSTSYGRIFAPLSKVKERLEKNPLDYYGMIRVIPKTDIIINKGVLEIKDLTFSLYDAAKMTKTGEPLLLQKWTIAEQGIESEEPFLNMHLLPENNNCKEISARLSTFINSHYKSYLGELLSKMVFPEKAKNYLAGREKVFKLKGDLFKIGNFFSNEAFLTVRDNDVFEQKYDFREQINNDKKHTNYLMNISMGAFSSQGSPPVADGQELGKEKNNFWTPFESNFYTPVLRDTPVSWDDSWPLGTRFFWTCKENEPDSDRSDYWDYLLDSYHYYRFNKEKNVYSPEEVTSSTIKYIGIATLRRLLLNNDYLDYLRYNINSIDWGLEDPIAFIGAYGVQPWGAARDQREYGYQIYWETNILQGMYLYLPKNYYLYATPYLEKYPIRTILRDRNNLEIGTIFYIGEINKSEINFPDSLNNDTYLKVVDGDRWRLVKNEGINESGVHYIQISDENGHDQGYLKLSESEYNSYNSLSSSSSKNLFVTNLINTNMQRLKTEEQMMGELVEKIFLENSGKWRVYDGYDTNTNGNKANYQNYRQVVDSRYSLQNEKINFDAIAIRQRNKDWVYVSDSTSPTFSEAAELIWSNKCLMPENGYSGVVWGG